jgi:ribosomal protein S18 acetylase RimI-like enzyme
VSVAFRFAPATEEDFERLLDLRLRVMREHLERVGRYDPERARAMLRRRFSPATMRRIEVDGALVGCVDVVRRADHVEIGLFYLEPAFQGRGLGRAVLDAVLAEMPEMPHRLEVLKRSPAARLYERAGFMRVGETEWDVQFERPAAQLEA